MNSISQRVNLTQNSIIHLGPVLYVGQGAQFSICYMWVKIYFLSTAKQTQG